MRSVRKRISVETRTLADKHPGSELGSDQGLEGFLEEERPGHGAGPMPRPLREMERPGSMSPLGRDPREPAWPRPRSVPTPLSLRG